MESRLFYHLCKMYHNFTQDELRTFCKVQLEAFEKWARLFIDKILSSELGKEYFFEKNCDGNYKIKKSLVNSVIQKMEEDPVRFNIPINCLFLEDIIYLLCKEDFYREHFKAHLEKHYPEGKNELSTFLKRLVPIRNKLSHSNPISVREVEQCICYSNDFIDAVKDYFAMTNQNKDFNVPTIIRVNDSLGNEYNIVEGRRGERVDIVDTTTGEINVFHEGDTLSIELTMDPSFAENEYSIEWPMSTDKQRYVEITEAGKKVTIKIEGPNIGEEVVFFCRVVSNKNWHRYTNYDQQLIFHFTAHPLS